MSESDAGKKPAEAPARRGRDVFISYSREDKATADAVCAALEGAGIPCWIGPRDTQAGAYGRSIMEAIRSARMLVLILSPNADSTPNVLTEVAEAFDRKLPLLPFRLANFAASDQMRFYIRTQHWIDAFPGSPEPHLASLIARVREHLGVPVTAERAPAPTAGPSGVPSVPPPARKRRWVLSLTAVFGALSIGLTVSFTASRLSTIEKGEFDTGKIEASLVRVIAEFGVAPGQATTNIRRSSGTGFVIERGYVVTANHVVTLGSNVTGSRVFVGQRGMDRNLAAEVIWQSDEFDLAVLRVPGITAAALTLWGGSIDSDPRLGTQVIALGYPAVLEREEVHRSTPSAALTRGVVERTVTRAFGGPQPLRAVQHSARLGSGSSGGPLVDGCGRVLALNAFLVPDKVSGQTVAFAVHIGLLTEALRTVPQLKGVRPVLSDSSDCRG